MLLLSLIIVLCESKKKKSYLFLIPGDSFVLDIPNASDDSLTGQTFQRPLAANQFIEDRKYEKRGNNDISYGPKHGPDKDTFGDSIPSYTANRGNFLLVNLLYTNVFGFFVGGICKTCHHVVLLEVQEAF